MKSRSEGAKTCFKCGRDLPLSEFYRHPQTADGHLNKCKGCTREDVRRNRASRREQYSRYEQRRAQSPERKTQKALAQRRLNRAKKLARTAVSNALKSGRLTKGLCEACGSPEVEAHHDDYARPLDVRWFCFKHHREVVHGQTVVATKGSAVRA